MRAKYRGGLRSHWSAVNLAALRRANIITD
jgi:hypothetical protein